MHKDGATVGQCVRGTGDRSAAGAGGRQEQTFLVAENGGWRIEAACCPPNAR